MSEGGEMEAYLWGRNSRLSGEVGRREAVIEVTAETMQNFICDDVGLRAVIRSAAKVLRDHDPLHPLLDRKNRDAAFGSEYQKFIDEKGEKYDAGWRPHLANRVSLEMLAREIMSASAGKFTEGDAKKIYVEAYNTENEKLNKNNWDAYAYKKSFKYPFGVGENK